MNKIKKITLKEAEENLKNNQKVVLIFSTDWCGECKMNSLIWEKVFPEFKDILVSKIDVDEAQVWAENNNDFFAINVVPTLMAFKDGKKLFVLENFTPEPNLRKALAEFN